MKTGLQGTPLDQSGFLATPDSTAMLQRQRKPAFYASNPRATAS